MTAEQSVVFLGAIGVLVWRLIPEDEGGDAFTQKGDPRDS
jgi:hypothetical protein